MTDSLPPSVEESISSSGFNSLRLRSKTARACRSSGLSAWNVKPSLSQKISMGIRLAMIRELHSGANPCILGLRSRLDKALPGRRAFLFVIESYQFLNPLSNGDAK